MNCVDAGNVFVHLFSQTKTRYILTNKKLQYLLIIAQMSRLMCGKTLFNDDIRNFKNGFVLDAIGDNFVSSTAIVSGTSKNMAITGEVSDFVLPYTNKKIFHISKMPTEDEKQLLIKVFLNFGAYSEEMLCGFLNSFQPLRNGSLFKAVSKKKINKVLLDAVTKESDVNNTLVSFLKTEYSESMKRNRSPVQQVAPVAPMVKPAETKDVNDEVLCPGILKNLTSLKSIVVDKKYTVFVEVPSSRYSCQVTVTVPSLRLALPGVLKKVSNTLYSYTFDGVAADIKISANIV